ncbi:hypothetical protein [Phormidium pseudopriestleyi]|nr:hypothetical protein [Phormidium pseudopriestleyi]
MIQLQLFKTLESAKRGKMNAVAFMGGIPIMPVTVKNLSPLPLTT